MKNRNPAPWLTLLFFLVGALPSAHALDRSLSGAWIVAPDPDNVGLKQEWWTASGYPSAEAKPIQVPGTTYEALPAYNGLAWYQHSFRVDELPAHGRRSFLRFGRVQYRCRVWLNSHEVGGHEGAETSFEIEVTGRLAQGANLLTVQVENPLSIFRNGKVPVFWDPGGILGQVDLVVQPRVRIADVYARPDPATGVVVVEVTCDNPGEPGELGLVATVSERASLRAIHSAQARFTALAGKSVQRIELKVPSPHLWDVNDPFLYTIEIRATAAGDEDVHRIERLGFRDFRVVDGYFLLNGRRLFLKGVHHNHYDPVLMQGTVRDMTWLGVDAARLKAAGFNMFRSIASALLPEQLAIADELGLLVYSEHAGSWILRDSEKFLVELPAIMHRDRHSPSLVMYGLLNEIDSRSPGVFEVARDSLPVLRQVDNTRLIMLSSGRWDRDFAHGSASNPGSSTWNVLLGGEGPEPRPTGDFPDLPYAGETVPVGGYINGAGDIHIYNAYPSSWDFLTRFRTLGAKTRPIFVSEAGFGSAFDLYTERLQLLRARAPASSPAWRWTTPRIETLEQAWKRYDLAAAYPDIPSMIGDSQRAAARERDLFFRALRANPQFNGYSLTSMTDAGGAGEGIWDNFRSWKAGHEAVITAGWAPTRFCLLANPTPVDAARPLHLVVALADEDRIAAGPHQATVRVVDDAGIVRWIKSVPFTLGQPGLRPFSVVLLDDDLPVLPLTEGHATVEASLDGGSELTGSRLTVPVYEPARHARLEGEVQVTGLGVSARDLISQCGGAVEEFNPSRVNDKNVIVCGPQPVTGSVSQHWRSIYEQAARGAHVLVVGPKTLQGRNGPLHFLPVETRGMMVGKADMSVYHREVVAKPSPVFDGLPACLLTAEVYGQLLHNIQQISGATMPEAALAVAFNPSGMGELDPGLVIATWKLGAGLVTVCTLDLPAHLGEPVADRLFINLVRQAQAGAQRLQPLPADYAKQLDKLGIVE